MRRPRQTGPMNDVSRRIFLLLLMCVSLITTSCVFANAFQSRPIQINTTSKRTPFTKTTTTTTLTTLHSFRSFFPKRPKRSRSTNGDSDDSDDDTALASPISSFVMTKDRQKLANANYEWEEEDFLLADVLPKQLIHERDFFRVTTRVSAWDQYVIVSILCTSICFSTISSYAINPDHVGVYFYEVIVRTVLQMVAGAAVLCGIYSTTVFTISILYGKTALGLEQDTQFDNFLDNTADIRKRAFWAFSYALALFSVMVSLVLIENLPSPLSIPVGATLLVALYFFYMDWDTLTSSAEEVFEDD